MAAKKKPAPRKKKKKKTPKRFRFQLGLSGVAGIAVVIFCLFLWMFLLGIWAGQTILLPPAPVSPAKTAKLADRHEKAVKILQPSGKKTPVSKR